LETGISARLTPAEGRKFGLLVGSAFLVLAVVFWLRHHPASASIALVLAVGLILGGLFLPGRMGPIYRGWMALAKAISKVTTPIFMGAVFFLVFTPAGVIARLFGHRPLSRRRDAASYWLSRPSGSGRSDLDHQY
jgi:saxitoxin biosynthesis operon SxtJ-like protein